jgi:hypothetical protein
VLSGNFPVITPTTTAATLFHIHANSSDLSRVAVAAVAVAVVQEVEVGFYVFTRTPPTHLIRSLGGTTRRHRRRLGGAF